MLNTLRSELEIFSNSNELQKIVAIFLVAMSALFSLQMYCEGDASYGIKSLGYLIMGCCFLIASSIDKKEIEGRNMSKNLVWTGLIANVGFEIYRIL